MRERSILGLCIVAMTACSRGDSVVASDTTEPGSQPQALTEAPAEANGGDALADSEVSPAAPMTGPGAPATATGAPDASVTARDAGLADPDSDESSDASAPPRHPCWDYDDDELPPTGWSPEAWEPHAASESAEKLQAVQAALPGKWRGEMRNIWTAPYLVDLNFREDGTYSAACTNLPAACCTALYWGTNDDTPLKRYQLDAWVVSGEVFADMVIPYGSNGSYAVPTQWSNQLRHIELDASGNGLRFTLERSDNKPALTFDLRRVTPEPDGAR